ncbi:hypothetical protein FYJ44_01160 [Desulfovibrio sp. PG-178-WT-4]|uniref:Uncharacterized protein n=2 Tax=Desulfovibrio porci TaxID=2605782 RepID=A0A6L5XHX6_9BACT|nr:hypothetical protein [Desulfovibrio porci]
MPPAPSRRNGMTPSPNHPDDPRGDGNLPERISGHSANQDQRRVLDAEVLEPGQEHSRNDHDAMFGGQGQEQGRGFSGAQFGGFGSGGLHFGRIWTSGRADQNACLAPCISFALFMVCLAQFGLLAGIGFVFFHIVGSVAGGLRDMRQLMQGRQPNPWPWRMGNWLVSFLLTAWLAGGFD